MTMLPNYILSAVFVVFLIHSYITLRIRIAQVYNKLFYVIDIIIAIILLAMSIYGIIFNIPLSQVQALIESKFN